jgi:Phosphoenolpyruvate carboxylase
MFRLSKPKSCCALQGEVLEQQFGEEEAAFRTLDLYTSAVLESSLAPTKAPKPEWRTIMAEMSKARRPAPCPLPCMQPACTVTDVQRASCPRSGLWVTWLPCARASPEKRGSG